MKNTHYQIPDSKELAEKVARATIQELGKQLVKNNDSRRLIRQYKRLIQIRKEA